MRIENFGIRVVGTNDLFWGPDHTRRFKPWPETARRFATVEEANDMAKQIAETNADLNARCPHLSREPVEFEIVKLITEVAALAA